MAAREEGPNIADVVNDRVTKLGEKARALSGRELALVLAEVTVHGKRRGFHQGIMLVASNKDCSCNLVGELVCLSQHRVLKK